MSRRLFREIIIAESTIFDSIRCRAEDIELSFFSLLTKLL